jgi:hypothetical protein
LPLLSLRAAHYIDSNSRDLSRPAGNLLKEPQCALR